MDKCHVCGSAMKKEKVKVKLRDQSIEVDGVGCAKCGEVLLNPEQAQKLLALNKLYAGIEAKVGALGKSLVVRIPADVREFLKLGKGDKLVFTTDGKKLVLEKS
ncbi:MAG: AbrB/MazE/SpoVT family DNA-binding domain-containing protein [Methanobacteriota archaeon]